ncbi:hypothetical protein IP93_00025 [Lysobacter ruishenii]|uniref:Uncharacterized protein n=2 Tax=Aerolutibacter ruishenii TaxID=686800 RepID=A0A562M275_9GAMM|nr:hypothetical protein IP93_00025 [Lysobacter ruishenii]
MGLNGTILVQIDPGRVPAMLCGLFPSPPCMPPASPSPSRRVPWLSPLLLALATVGFAAIWTLVALYTNRQVSWLAVIGALDMAWMLRLSGWPAGRGRMAAAVAATAAMIVLANWSIIAAHLGGAMGLKPWESITRLGSDHAWTLAQLANGPMDLLWMAVSLATAAWLAR